jgi:predicted alpha/beta hydrolase
MKRNLRIPVRDDINIGISVFDTGNPRGILVLNPAMGVPRAFYDDFANWMSTQGYHVVTWNYRGTADSGDPRNSDAHIHDWGEADLDTLLGWCREQWPGLPLVIGAHSVGGQIIGMASNARHADAIITIASQSGYWKHYRGLLRWQIVFLWFLFIPLACRLLGYFPGRILGNGGDDIPANVARQWARWGRDPDYLQGRHRRNSADGYAAITCPLLGVWIGDDDLATWAANRAMLGWYLRADITTLDLVPAQQGMQRIGHFGFFRAERGRDRLWPQLTRWLDTVLPSVKPENGKEVHHVPAGIRD